MLFFPMDDTFAALLDLAGDSPTLIDRAISIFETVTYGPDE